MAEAVVEAGDAVAVEAAVEADHTYQRLPNLGVGLGFRDPYTADVFRSRASVDFLELVADHFFEPTPAKQRQLDLLRSHFAVIPHGLALSLGSAEGLDQTYLEMFAHLVDQVRPAWWSEHIAFTRAGGIDIGHLTPLPKTRESLFVLRQNIETAKQAIPIPLILENITETITFPGQELEEAEFLTEIVTQNDCGLLLDITNLYTNSVNQRFDPLKVLWKLPPDRIVQLHFVGGHWEGNTLIDSHSSSTPEEVWQLMEEVVKYAPVKGIILERDEQLPAFDELLHELDRARSILQRHHEA